MLAPLTTGTAAFAEVGASAVAGQHHEAGAELLEPCDGSSGHLEAARRGRGQNHSMAEVAAPAPDLGPSNRFEVRTGTSPPADGHDRQVSVDLAELGIQRV